MEILNIDHFDISSFMEVLRNAFGPSLEILLLLSICLPSFTLSHGVGGC